MNDKPLIDIATVIGVSTAAFAIELLLTDVLPWGEEARGVIAVLAGAAAAIWLTLNRGGTLADLGIRRPARWLTVPLWAFGILVIFIIAQAMVPVLVGQVIDVPQPDMSRYDVIRGNLAAAVFFAIALPLVAAIPEEIVYRGFLIERFTAVFGGDRGAAWLAAFVQAFIFGLVHFQWGAGGIVVTTIMGLIWGIAFLLSGRNLWIVIIAHSTAHLLLVMQLYFTPLPP